MRSLCALSLCGEYSLKTYHRGTESTEVAQREPARQSKKLFQKLIAKQLARPSGPVGRVFMARWLNKANLKMNQLTFEQLAIETGDRILEVGFGGGDLLEKILAFGQTDFVAGVDVSAEMVRRANGRLQRHISEGKLEARLGDVAALPYASGEFTKVCSVNTLYFWPNPATALAECRRVLRPGGRLLLCFNSKKDLEAWPIHKHGFRLYELDEVEDMFRVAGFATIEVVSGKDDDQGKFYCVSGTAV